MLFLIYKYVWAFPGAPLLYLLIDFQQFLLLNLYLNYARLTALMSALAVDTGSAMKRWNEGEVEGLGKENF